MDFAAIIHSTAMTYVLLGGLAIALATAAFTDARRRQIDNWLNVAVALGAPLFWVASGLGWADIAWQVAVAVAAFVVLAALFAAGAMGGGDVKLLTALALWVRPMAFVHLLEVMALAGGVLTLFLALWHVARRSRTKVVVPYGIAIAVGGFWVIATECWPAHAAALIG